MHCVIAIWVQSSAKQSLEPRTGMWSCPICTLGSGKPMLLNDVPYRHSEPKDFKNQATAHIQGKGHNKSRQKVAVELFTSSGCARFFHIIGRSIPNSMQNSPADAIKEYTEDCGGNGDKTILKLAPLPPPDPMLRPTVVCRSEIVSPDYATKVAPEHVMRTQLLCCWDDPLGTTQCTRHACPYRHTKDLGTLEHQYDFYKLIPCNFAGMPGGCRHHKMRFKGKNWTVPVWRTTGSKAKNPSSEENPSLNKEVLYARGETVEYVPVYDGDAWELYQCRPCDPGMTQMQLEQITGEDVRYMKECVKRYLAGDDDDSD